MKKEYLKIAGALGFYDSIAANDMLVSTRQMPEWIAQAQSLGVKNLYIVTLNGDTKAYYVSYAGGEIEPITYERFNKEFLSQVESVGVFGVLPKLEAQALSIVSADTRVAEIEPSVETRQDEIIEEPAEESVAEDEASEEDAPPEFDYEIMRAIVAEELEAFSRDTLRRIIREEMDQFFKNKLG